MAIPIEKNVCLPLLKVIADAGGELLMAKAIRAVEKFFPSLTEDDKLEPLPSGRSKRWSNRVQWARQRLIQEGHLDRQAPRGIWRITQEGKEYLEREWPNWKPRYSKETESDRSGLPLHEKLKNYLSQIGEILKKYPEKERRETPYIYDVIWREFAESPRASHVFEVQDKGNLIEALAKLQHAREIWGSKLFLIVTGEKDHRRLSQLVGPLLSGTFHRLSQDLIVLSQEDTERLYETLSEEKELLKHLLI
ncbi:hypothetical protein E3J84_06300 [Candidatus Aerophobetes bacterium]|uniref:Restriction system protein Mrr-like N-terminal domain-containing protein n=1 Tax=Aerophobetes bacterium TaxID=2030807 RepID=A0A523RRS3_UNCAE|nr:MAG: hypothetical protein E3J84_06300 [Candidatus Aerophobetes bacterium]